MKQRPWSKLQREIYDLLTPTINLQIHCTCYPMRSQNGGSTDFRVTGFLWIKTLSGIIPKTLWRVIVEFRIVTVKPVGTLT